MSKKTNYIRLLDSSKKKLSANTHFAVLDQWDLRNNITNVHHIIVELFNAFGKGDAKTNRLLCDIQKLEEIRCAHIIFTFLLGLHIYDKSTFIKESINKEVGKLLKDAKHENDFTFLWFLVCLFHDLGYSEENKGEKSEINHHWACENKMDKTEGIPALLKNTYLNYFIYRKTEHFKTDHGIYAGLRMFHDLFKIREEMEAQNQDKDVWRKGLIPLYKLASCVVLVHNIWFAKDTDIETCSKYRKYQLDKLILKTNKGGTEIKDFPIKLSKHPLLFLFCIVDLIEPMKRFGNIECCNKIDFTLTDDCLSITSKIECCINNQYLNDIINAYTWLTKTEKITNGVKIMFK